MKQKKKGGKKKLLIILAVIFLIGILSAAFGDTEEVSEPTPAPAETERVTILHTPPVTETETPTETPTPAAPTEAPAETEEPSAPAENSTFSIHFIDVGQADAALVECDGHYMLIDGGNKADSSRIYSVLKSANVPKLDIVVGTHAHEDHIGGLPGAFNYTTADVTLCPVTSYDSDAFNDFARYATEKGGGLVVPSVGDTYNLGSAAVQIVGVNGGEDTNDTTIVLKIAYGETSFLFTGDAEREAEQAVLNSGADISATVLKVGHHGSDTSTTYPFLREISPVYAVISVGEGNTYGHPTEDTLSRLRDADVTTYRTDLQGDIVCTSDGQTVTFGVEKNKDANTLAPVVVPTVQPVPEPTPQPTTEPTHEPAPEPTPQPAPQPTPEPQQPSAGVSYILNTSKMKIHYPDCRSVKQMSEENKWYFTGTRDEAIAMGYDPCGNCRP